MFLPGVRPDSRTVCCAAAAGTTNQGTADAPIATGTILTTGTTTTDSELPSLSIYCRNPGVQGHPERVSRVQSLRPVYPIPGAEY